MKQVAFDSTVKWKIKDFVIIYLLSAVVSIVVTSVVIRPTQKIFPLLSTYVMFICWIIGISITLRRRKAKWADLGLTKGDNGNLILKGVVIAVLLFFATEFIFYRSSLMGLFQSDLTSVKISLFVFAPISIIGFQRLLLGPFLEELLYRGLLYQSVRAKLNKIMSIAIVVVVNNILHFPKFSDKGLFLMAGCFVKRFWGISGGGFCKTGLFFGCCC